MGIFPNSVSEMITINDRLHPLVKQIMPGQRNQVLAFDPGETTGVAYIDIIQGAEKFQLEYFQLDTKSVKIATTEIRDTLRCFGENTNPDFRRVVAENYRVYGWKAETHKWNDLTTSKLLGVIESMAYLSDFTFVLRMAHTPKRACNDQNLKLWGIEIPTKFKHAKDATRHAFYEVMWPKTEVDK